MKVIHYNYRPLKVAVFGFFVTASLISASAFAQTVAPPVTITNDSARAAWIESAQASVDDSSVVVHGRIQRSMSQRIFTHHRLVLRLLDNAQQLRETQTVEINPSKLPFRNRSGMPFTIKLASPLQPGDVVRVALQKG